MVLGSTLLRPINPQHRIGTQPRLRPTKLHLKDIMDGCHRKMYSQIRRQVRLYVT